MKIRPFGQKVSREALQTRKNKCTTCPGAFRRGPRFTPRPGERRAARREKRRPGSAPDGLVPDGAKRFGLAKVQKFEASAKFKWPGPKKPKVEELGERGVQGGGSVFETFWMEVCGPHLRNPRAKRQKGVRHFFGRAKRQLVWGCRVLDVETKQLTRILQLQNNTSRAFCRSH